MVQSTLNIAKEKQMANTDEPYKNKEQRVLDAIIGAPPIITVDIQAGSLYNAFSTAVSTFEAKDHPDWLLKMSYDTLEKRVYASSQENALDCFSAFNKHYKDQINSFKTGNDKIPDTDDSIDLLVTDAENSLLSFKNDPTEKRRRDALNDYDALINYIVNTDTDDAHERLEAYQEQYATEIKALLSSSGKGHHPPGKTAPSPRPDGYK